MLRVLSLGGGVQSGTTAIRIAKGLVPMVDCAIFADTKHESAATYAYLDWIESQVPFPIHRVSKGDLWKAATRVRRTRDGERTYIETAIPAFLVNGESLGKGQRHCTVDFKIDPINAKVRQLLGRKRVGKNSGVLAQMLIGISTDEYIRMKPNRLHWIESQFPLMEAGMSRADCLHWMEQNGYPLPPRSACTFCPHRSDEAWLDLTKVEFADAAKKEKQLQVAYASTTEIESVPYLHESRKLLTAVKLDPRKRRKMAAEQRNMFINDCSGMCGV